MNTDKLKQAIDYSDVYYLIAAGAEELEKLDEGLRERAANPSALQRRRKWLMESPAYLSIEDGTVTLDVETLSGDIDELRALVIPEWYDQLQEKKKHENFEEILEQNKKLSSLNSSYESTISEQKERISKLESEIKTLKEQLLNKEMSRKVLVSSSIKVGPKKESMDDIFLNDVERLLDVEKCVVKYGGELDSFYEEIQTDNKDDKGFEPGHELTHRNHCLRIMKRIGTKEFFKKRVKDNQEAKKIEERVGQLFPNHGGKKTEWQKERDRILRNRFMSVNSILQNSDLTNQEKLIMYAMNGEYHNTNIERLLVFAAQHCIHADFLIYILEDPDVCTTYENTVGFLDQFANASEFRMKLNLARELIDGKWYITADYNGKDTKFQLVPIDEFNELRRAAGLPESKFTYKNKDDKKEESKEEVKKEEEEPVEKPEFVERSQVSSQKVDIPDDGFEPYKDKENTEEEVPEEPDLPFN